MFWLLLARPSGFEPLAYCLGVRYAVFQHALWFPAKHPKSPQLL